LSPRGDWRAPSDAVASVWREELRESLPADVVDKVFGDTAT
jgi:NAD+ synthase (glutamine-hydrolysing)